MTDITNIATPDLASTNGDVTSDDRGVFDDILETMDPEEGDKKKESGKTSTDQEFEDTADPWKLARTFQSEKDKANAEIQKLNQRIQQEYEPAVEFIHQVYEDDEVRQAFLSELAPDLVKQKDPHTFINESLAKEFGNDFEPDDAEVTKPGTKSWMYSKVAEKLLEKALGEQKSTPKSLKDLREKRKQLATNRQKEAEAERNKILNDFKWDEATYNNFLEWGKKVRTYDVAKLFDRLNKQSSKNINIPNLTSVPGGGPVVPNQFKIELDNMFGPD